MTYCLGILLDDGLVLASDSRSNAGANDIKKVRKLALLSYDATIQGNWSVDGPIDLLRYAGSSLSAGNFQKYSREDRCWSVLREKYGEGLLALVDTLPALPD